LHMASTVRLQRLSRLALGLGITPPRLPRSLDDRRRPLLPWRFIPVRCLPTPLGFFKHVSGLRQNRRIASVASCHPGITLIEARPRGPPPQRSDACNSPRARQTSRRSADLPPRRGDACSPRARQTIRRFRQPRGPSPQRSNASIHPARGKRSGGPPTHEESRTPHQRSN
jgi:hypothetical protein